MICKPNKQLISSCFTWYIPINNKKKAISKPTPFIPLLTNTGCTAAKCHQMVDKIAPELMLVAIRTLGLKKAPSQCNANLSANVRIVWLSTSIPKRSSIQTSATNNVSGVACLLRSIVRLRARRVGSECFSLSAIPTTVGVGWPPYSFAPPFGANMWLDGYRSMRSPGDGGHVTRFGRQVTASPIPSQVKPQQTIYVHSPVVTNNFRGAVFECISRHF